RRRRIRRQNTRRRDRKDCHPGECLAKIRKICPMRSSFAGSVREMRGLDRDIMVTLDKTPQILPQEGGRIRRDKVDRDGWPWVLGNRNGARIFSGWNLVPIDANQ